MNEGGKGKGDDDSYAGDVRRTVADVWCVRSLCTSFVVDLSRLCCGPIMPFLWTCHSFLQYSDLFGPQYILTRYCIRHEAHYVLDDVDCTEYINIRP
jgi:hypothetical protein